MTGIIASAPQAGEFKQIEAGVYPARCFSVIDLGTHKGEYMGNATLKRQVRVGWEFPTETAVFNEELGEQPFALFKTYTLSLSEKSNLRKDLEMWRGKKFTEEELRGFDLKNILGKTCQIQVISDPDKKDPSKTYSKIAGILSLPKGMEIPEQVNQSQYVDQEAWHSEDFERLGQKTKEKIMQSEEWSRSSLGDVTFGTYGEQYKYYGTE